MSDWTPRDTRRWAAKERRIVVAGDAHFTTPELCRAEGPAPATWNIIGQVTGVAAADVAAVAFSAVITLGLGSTTDQFEVPFTPGTPWTAVLLPAQWVSVQVKVAGAAGVGGNWIFSAFCAPQTQWAESHVKVVEDGE